MEDMWCSLRHISDINIGEVIISVHHEKQEQKYELHIITLCQCGERAAVKVNE